jgi:hypothetical protein
MPIPSFFSERCSTENALESSKMSRSLLVLEMALRCKSNKKKTELFILIPHSLKLAVGDTMNVCLVLKDTIELTKLVMMSPKRNGNFRLLQHEQQSSVQCDSGGFNGLLKNPSIKLLCRIRWKLGLHASKA